MIRAVYWPRERLNQTPVEVPAAMKVALGFCVAGMLYLGIFPSVPLRLAERAVALLSQAL